jgi:hypothetical protein
MNELLQRLLRLLDEMSDLLAKDKTTDGGDHYLRESFTDRNNWYQYAHKDQEFMHLLKQYNRDYVDHLCDLVWAGASMETTVKESYSLLRKNAAVD